MFYKKLEVFLPFAKTSRVALISSGTDCTGSTDSRSSRVQTVGLKPNMNSFLRTESRWKLVLNLISHQKFGSFGLFVVSSSGFTDKSQ